MSRHETDGVQERDRHAPVIAVDPGSDRCGLAAVAVDGTVLERDIVEADQVGLAAAALAHSHGATVVVLGTRTGSPRAWELIHAAAPELAIAEVEEHMTTLEARERYWLENPPGCVGKLIPRGLRVPPVPIDDWAAAIIAERYLHGTRAGDEDGCPRGGRDIPDAGEQDTIGSDDD